MAIQSIDFDLVDELAEGPVRRRLRLLPKPDKGHGREEWSEFPCIDNHRHYRGCLGRECQAERCWAGPKPCSPPRPPLAPGQRYCARCSKPYYGSGRSRYCSDECRYQAMLSRRRRRRARLTEYDQL